MFALKRLNFVGSVVGNLLEVAEALDFTARGLVKVRNLTRMYLSSLLMTCSQFCLAVRLNRWTNSWKRWPRVNSLVGPCFKSQLDETSRTYQVQMRNCECQMLPRHLWILYRCVRSHHRSLSILHISAMNKHIISDRVRPSHMSLIINVREVGDYSRHLIRLYGKSPGF